MMMCCLTPRSLTTGECVAAGTYLANLNHIREVFSQSICLPLFTCCSVLDIQKVLDGDIEIEAMDSHNNWLRSRMSTAHLQPTSTCTTLLISHT